MFPRAKVSRTASLQLVLSGLVVIAFVLNLGMGAVSISPDRVVAVLLHHAGIDVGIPFTAQQDAVLWTIRLPRVCAALAIGAGLALAGAAIQAIFRNPLADPSLIGVSSGSAVGAIALIVVGTAPIGAYSLPLA